MPARFDALGDNEINACVDCRTRLVSRVHLPTYQGALTMHDVDESGFRIEPDEVDNSRMVRREGDCVKGPRPTGGGSDIPWVSRPLASLAAGSGMAQRPNA